MQVYDIGKSIDGRGEKESDDIRARIVTERVTML